MRINLFGLIIEWKTGRDTAGKCLKVAYRRLKDAEKAISKQARLGRTRYVYSCPHCGKFHLTKMKQ